MRKSRLAMVLLGAVLVALAGCGDTGPTIPRITGIYNGKLVFYRLPDTTVGDSLNASATIVPGANGSFSGTWKATIGFRDSLSGTLEEAKVGALDPSLGTDVAPLQFRLHVTQAGCTGDFTTSVGYFARAYPDVNVWSFAGKFSGSASCFRSGTSQRGIFITTGRAFAPSRLDNPFEPVSLRPAARPLRSAH